MPDSLPARAGLPPSQGTAEAAPEAGAARGRAPVVILLLLLLVVMVPIELNLSVGSVLFTASRAYLVVLTFMILPRLGSFRWRSYDWFFAVHVALSCLAFLRAYPLADGVERAGSYLLEMLVLYLVVRIYLRELAHFRAVVGLLFLMAVVAAAFAIPEAYTGRRFAHEIASAITGNSYRIDRSERMGILRAASLFEHPILYGVFCSSLFSLVWFTSTPAQRAWKAPLLTLATFYSASSAPFLVIGLQWILVGVERVTRGLKRRVAVFSWMAGGMGVILESFTGRGIVGVVILMTLNPATAYTRRSQWEYGIDDVMRHPFLGFAPETWTRPSWLAPSMDNWWLLIMMRSGIPSLVMLALCALTIWLALARRRDTPELYDRLRTGWGLMMIALILGAATVTFFGKLQPLFSFYLAFGAALANCALPEREGGAAAPAVPEPRLRFTRFPAGELPPARASVLATRDAGHPARPAGGGLA